jgi:hypothetical protein
MVKPVDRIIPDFAKAVLTSLVFIQKRRNTSIELSA